MQGLLWLGPPLSPFRLQHRECWWMICSRVVAQSALQPCFVSRRRGPPVQLSTLTGREENYSFALFEQINRCFIAVFVRRVNNDLHTIAVLEETNHLETRIRTNERRGYCRWLLCIGLFFQGRYERCSRVTRFKFAAAGHSDSYGYCW
jgi:hypothetical protein